MGKVTIMEHPLIQHKTLAAQEFYRLQRFSGNGRRNRHADVL